MSEEWGPWIEHDGKGCPVAGQVVEIIRRNGEKSGPYVAYTRNRGGVPGSRKSDSWVHLPKPHDVIRYRVRKPRGLTILENLVASLDAPEGPAKAPGKVKA